MAASDVRGGPVIEIWEPTYRMAPEEKERFLSAHVREIIQKAVEERMEGLVWDSDKCKDLAVELSSVVKERVKALDLPRYKLVAQAYVGEVAGQGATVASRCLWDTKTDNCASFSYKSETVFCTVVVYGLYLE